MPCFKSSRWSVAGNMSCNGGSQKQASSKEQAESGHLPGLDAAATLS